MSRLAQAPLPSFFLDEEYECDLIFRIGRGAGFFYLCKKINQTR